jgi:uncharacterized Ntn-hydrolase superfamily protein
MTRALCLLLVVLASTAAAEPQRPVHTYSIVARDPATGELGVAVQSHWFSVGPLVVWAESEVGAVATQSFVEPSYGPIGLQLMRAGVPAPLALRALTVGDFNRERRQIAFLDSKGTVAAHTGALCIGAAGHRTGVDYSVQANLMENDKVWPAMAAAFESAKGDLAERMLQALEAAEKAGGDVRGKQSAALVVVRGKSTGKPWLDRTFDLRVDDHPAPLVELRRLVEVQRAYNHMNAGDEAMAMNDLARADREYGIAAKMLPSIAELPYWHAIALASAGKLEQAIPMFQKVFAAEPRWIEITRRLPKAQLLDAELAKQIEAKAAQRPSR